MGIDYGYFAAVDDATAVTAIELLGGPAWWSHASRRTAGVAPAPRPGVYGRWRRRRSDVPDIVVTAGPVPTEEAAREEDSVPEPFDVFYTRAIDPDVQLGTLQELLTGREYDDIMADHLGDEPLASREDGSRLVVALSEEIGIALATATPERLAEVVIPWSHTEEYARDLTGEDEVLLSMLAADVGELAALARRAHGRGDRLYCWIAM